jgi:hypothetical protein
MRVRRPWSPRTPIPSRFPNSRTGSRQPTSTQANDSAPAPAPASQITAVTRYTSAPTTSPSRASTPTMRWRGPRRSWFITLAAAGACAISDISGSSSDGSTGDISLESGDMTPEEAALGYPNNSAFTHTEHRFSRMAGASTGPKVSLSNDPFAGEFPLSAGDAVRMQGQLPPCSRCKGAMNRMVKELGVSVTYEWSGAKGAGSWTAGRRRR